MKIELTKEEWEYIAEMQASICRCGHTLMAHDCNPRDNDWCHICDDDSKCSMHNPKVIRIIYAIELEFPKSVGENMGGIEK